MSQHDFNITNQLTPQHRTDLNNALAAMASLSSGASAPTTTYANMLWFDTSTSILKMRSDADDAWINMLYIDQSSNINSILDDTKVVNTSGTQTGLVGGQSTATWEAGAGTVESLISPANVKAAIESLVPAQASGLEFITSVDASSEATLDFTAFDATKYDSYVFTFANVTPTTGSYFRARTSTNGGSSYDSSSNNYQYRIMANGSASAAFETFIPLSGVSGSTIGLSADVDGISGTLEIHGPHLTKKTMVVFNGMHFGSTSSTLVDVSSKTVRLSSDDVNAIQFFFDSGNIESGTITMYGRRNS